MKDNGKETNEKDWDMNDLVMEIYTRESMLMEKYMDKEGTSGLVASIMKECGFKETKRDMVYGKVLRETLISVNGNRISHMDLESIFGVMVTHTKENGKHA